MTTSTISSTSVGHSRYALAGSLMVVLLLASGLLYWFYFPACGGVDEASYLLTAKGLAERGDPAYYAPDPTIFVPENMVEVRPGVFCQKYPIGYPLLVSVAYRLGGPSAGFLVNPLATVVALVGLFFLARRLLDDRWALLATLTFAIHPIILFYGVSALSHSTDLACVIWGMYFAWTWYTDGRWYRAGLAGFLLAFAASIRYSEALLALPVLWLAAARWFQHGSHGFRESSIAIPEWLRDVAAAFFGGVVALLPLIWFQYRSFGSSWTSGYALTSESSAFSWTYFQHHLAYALGAIFRPASGLFLLGPLGLTALIYLPFRRERVLAVFLTLWIFPILLLYIAYYWITTGSPVLYVRFFLPIYPALLLAGLLLLDRRTRGRALGRLAVQVLVLGAAFCPMGFRWDNTAGEGMNDLSRRGSLFARAHLPPQSVVVADFMIPYSLIYFSDFTVYYPSYFDREWVEARLQSGEEGPPAFNPLRARRMAEALGGRSQEALRNLLQQKLLGYCLAGRTVAVVTVEDFDHWPITLGPALTVERPVTLPEGLRLWHVRPSFAPSLLPPSSPVAPLTAPVAPQRGTSQAR